MNLRTTTFVIDVDNTICEFNRNKRYEELLPIQETVDKIKLLRDQGAYIILHTARGMKTHKGDRGSIEQFVRPVLEKWLAKYKVPYDELIMCKPGYKHFTTTVYYVDDKSLGRHEFTKFSPSEYDNQIDTTITYE